MLSSLSARNHDHELGDLAARHPFVELGHNLVDVGFNLIIRGD